MTFPVPDEVDDMLYMFSFLLAKRDVRFIAIASVPLGNAGPIASGPVKNFGTSGLAGYMSRPTMSDPEENASRGNTSEP